MLSCNLCAHSALFSVVYCIVYCCVLYRILWKTDTIKEQSGAATSIENLLSIFSHQQQCPFLHKQTITNNKYCIATKHWNNKKSTWTMISYLSKSVKSAKFEIILTEANSSFVAANIFNFFNFHSKPSKEISMMQYQKYFLQAKIIL